MGIQVPRRAGLFVAPSSPERRLGFNVRCPVLTRQSADTVATAADDPERSSEANPIDVRAGSLTNRMPLLFEGLMQANRFSRTAQVMAFFRALESARPASIRLLSDSFAGTVLPASMRRVVALSRFPLLRSVIQSSIRRVRAMPEVRPPGHR